MIYIYHIWSQPANGVVLSFLNPLNPLGPLIIFRDLGSLGTDHPREQFNWRGKTQSQG